MINGVTAGAWKARAEKAEAEVLHRKLTDVEILKKILGPDKAGVIIAQDLLKAENERLLLEVDALRSVALCVRDTITSHRNLFDDIQNALELGEHRLPTLAEIQGIYAATEGKAGG